MQTFPFRMMNKMYAGRWSANINDIHALLQSESSESAMASFHGVFADFYVKTSLYRKSKEQKNRINVTKRTL